MRASLMMAAGLITKDNNGAITVKCAIMGGLAECPTVTGMELGRYRAGCPGGEKAVEFMRRRKFRRFIPEKL